MYVDDVDVEEEVVFEDVDGLEEEEEEEVVADADEEVFEDEIEDHSPNFQI